MSEKRTIHLRNLGCRLNQGEIDQMARQFSGNGHTVTAEPETAGVIVINTCAVTGDAVRSSRQTIHQMHRANADAHIVVTGCYAHIAPQDIQGLPGVSHVIDNLAKESLVSIVTGEPLSAPEVYDHEPLQREAIIGAGGRTRAFLKVQDGCDRHCAFCVTRLARGAGRSKAVAAIVAEAQGLVAAGYRELVLTGVHLGSYGEDQGAGFALWELLAALLSDTDAPRIRLSSLEPWGIPDGFFRLWENPRLCRHLHLPLQSGSDATLKRMIRRTSQREFRTIVEAAREAIPNVALATDVIVGYPGETDAEFATSHTFIEDMHFAAMHIFRYSPRPGTAAIKLPNHISDAVKKARSETLQALAHREETAYARQFIGQPVTILWKAVSGASAEGYLNTGYTETFLRARWVGKSVLTNTITPAVITAYEPETRLAQASPLAGYTHPL